MLPYCYNYELNAENFFGSKLITQYGFTFQEIIDLFGLNQLSLDIDFATAEANTRSLTAQALVTALEELDIYLDWNIKEAVRYHTGFYQMCSTPYE